MNAVLKDMIAMAKEAARETPRLYFAPLVGAIRGIREEYRRIAQESAARTAARSESEEHAVHG